LRKANFKPGQEKITGDGAMEAVLLHQSSEKKEMDVSW
jgi:hypothetical protein